VGKLFIFKFIFFRIGANLFSAYL